MFSSYAWLRLSLFLCKKCKGLLKYLLDLPFAIVPYRIGKLFKYFMTTENNDVREEVNKV